VLHFWKKIEVVEAPPPVRSPILLPKRTLNTSKPIVCGSMPWTAVNGFCNKHRTQLEPTRVGDQVYRQPGD
jgi:hypothetical protein